MHHRVDVYAGYMTSPLSVGIKNMHWCTGGFIGICHLYAVVRSLMQVRQRIFLFMEGICGDILNPQQQARTFGNVLSIRQQMRSERQRALIAFKAGIDDNSYADSSAPITMPAAELNKSRNMS